MNVAQWLNAIDLGQYAALFHEHKIDAGVLPDLVEADLEKIGVPLGHRKRLMRAIAALPAGGTPPSAAKPASAHPSPSSPRSGAEAERRPITVMFCDLVGSTSLTARLDAEDWRNLVNAYLDPASAAVNGFGGHVLKKLGDGLMALFGYPQAQENDAERAVRAALAIQRALADLNARNVGRRTPQLIARIGLESGQLVVDAAGEVFGEAANVAARVQAVAEPGSILITAAVQRQTAGLFVAEDRGAHALKGVAAPLTLYRIVRASGAGRRSGQRALTPLVGRKEELDLLSRRWERARKGEGQLALVVGEPGIGKSRLIEEFRARLGETPHTWTEWSSSQLLQNTPLHPIAEYGRQRFGADLPAEQRLADIENALHLVGLDAVAYAPLLAPMLDIPLPKERAANFAPEELRRRQLAAMKAWILAAARTQPVVLAFEDLHWADPTSLDLMRTLADRGAQAPLLIIATTRPSALERPFASQRDLTVAARSGSGRAHGRQTRLTPCAVQRGHRGSERAQRRRAAFRRGGYAPAAGARRAGRRTCDPADLAALDRLAESDLVIVEGAPPSGSYRFKHALLRDAAYDSLLKSRRQTLHRRAADALVAADAEPEAVAHHFTETGLDDLAIEWWGKAGDQALRRSAFQEAIAHLGQAIEMADKGATAWPAPDGGAAPTQRLTPLRVAYGNALLQARGYGAPETTQAFARARESATVDKDAPGRLSADYGLWTSSYTRGELPSMRAHAVAFLNDAEASPDSPEAGVAHRAAGVTCWFAGGYREARDHLERAVALFQPGRDDDLAFRFGHDAGVGAMLYLAITLWPLGDVTRSIALVESARERLESITHVGTRAQGKCHAALFELMRGDHARATPNALELVRLAREYNLPFWRASGVFLEGWMTAATGAVGSGLEDMRGGAELLREQNLLWFDGLLKITLSEAEARAGDSERAVAILDEALAASDRTGYRAFEAELHRARGEMLLRRNSADPAPAEEAFLTAIAVAKHQATRSFELRAALPLAKLYQSTARPADAHAVLGPALEGFSPTPEFPEIAKALELAAAI
jgi:class 3 adenylate cyclase/predicted ATPase